MADKFSSVGLGDAIYELLKIPCEAAEAIEKGDVVYASSHVDDGLPKVSVGTDGVATAIGVAMNDASAGEIVNVLVVGAVKVTVGAGGIVVGQQIEAAADGAVEDGATATKVIGRALQTASEGDTAIVFINCLGGGA